MKDVEALKMVTLHSVHAGNHIPLSGLPLSSAQLDVSEVFKNMERRQRERKKQLVSQAKQHLCTCIALFCTFLSCFCTTTTWKCLILRFMEGVNNAEQLRNFLFLSLAMVPEIQLQEGLPTFDKYVGRNNRYNDWTNANSLFKLRSRCRRVPNVELYMNNPQS